MKIGAAKVSITPYFAKLWLAGFANPKRKFLGAHDEGWARAMYIEDGQEKICLVSIDNLGFDSSRLADMAPEIAEKTGLSTATISRVNKCLKYGNEGYIKALERVEYREKAARRK